MEFSVHTAVVACEFGDLVVREHIGPLLGLGQAAENDNGYALEA
jgi:hypothetical protein